MNRLGRLLLVACLIIPLLGIFSVAQTVEAQAVTIVTRNTVRLREQANTTSATLDKIPFNTTLTPDLITANRRWVRVSYNGKLGWVSTSFVRLTAGSYNSLPVVNGVVAPTATPVAGPVQISFSVQIVSGTPATGGGYLPGACVVASWKVANIDSVFFSTDGANYTGVVGEASSSVICINSTTNFYLRILTRDGVTLIETRTIEIKPA